jgi:Transglycosylase SLT domain
MLIMRGALLQKGPVASLALSGRQRHHLLSRDSLLASIAREMRHVIIPGCLCLATLSSQIGPELGLSVEGSIGKTPLVAIEQSLVQVPLPPILKPVIPRSREEICNALADSARSNNLPANFFIRLLYQESSFKVGVISSAGLGIAQFTPETATDRGVDNPFDALQAIPASAELLRDLYLQFGNLGLAAAAYNAGPKRVRDWLAKRASLPPETQKYVKTVTGWPAETWAAGEAGSLGLKLPQDAPCQDMANLVPPTQPENSSSSSIERGPTFPE